MSWVLHSSINLGEKIDFFNKILILQMQAIKLSPINVILNYN